MPTPTCTNNCDAELAEVKFDNCNPVVAFSEIRRLFMAKKSAAPFTDWTEAAEWVSRISPDSTTGNDYIRVLNVIGDKPAPAGVVKEISNGRRITIGKDHTINITIDDVSDENYEFMRQLECGGEWRFWYETEGGYLFGGNEGIVARFQLDSVLPRGREEIMTLVGSLTYRKKFTEERTISPIYDGESSVSAPQTFDTALTFAGSTSDVDAGITGTVPATDADLELAFNLISPRVGTPMTMTIKIGGVTVGTADFPSDYLGQYFKFTSTANVEYVGNFVNGTIDF